MPKIPAAPAVAPVPEQIVIRKPVEELIAERQVMLATAGLALVETDAQTQSGRVGCEGGLDGQRALPDLPD